MAKKATKSHKAPTKRSAVPSVAGAAAGTLRRESQAAQGQIEKGLREIGQAIADVQRGLTRAERRIETDARRRIRELRREVSKQMRVLEDTQRRATGLLGRITTAAGESWDDVVKTADSMVAEARTTAGAVIDRFRDALSS